jgi:hypothetical protein
MSEARLGDREKIQNKPENEPGKSTCISNTELVKTKFQHHVLQQEKRRRLDKSYKHDDGGEVMKCTCSICDLHLLTKASVQETLQDTSSTSSN